ncbi:replication protein C, IncQ-type [Comamonas antarctica]|uniref:replication protein C, IncQ-type n=1 Tax=Comamonas antarctica TaxID=2743470 RepID=UPI0028E51DFA|nr:replication protein C, IncQ-type [Comamonas antarctica]
MTKLQSLTHAKMAQPFVHAPLFCSLERGEQRRRKLDVTYVVNDSGSGAKATFRFWGPEPLGVTDLRVLQGLVAVATGQLVVDNGVPSMLRDGRVRRKDLRLEGDASASDAIAARFKLTPFAQALGYVRPGKATLMQLQASIERLSAVTVIVRKPGFEGSYRIVSAYERDSVTDEVVVGLSPGITAAVLGKSDYLRIDFGEVRKLKRDAARLIHSRLHWINHGARRAINIETLCDYVYGSVPASSYAVWKRKHTVREALKELVDLLGWGVYELTPGRFTVQRPWRAISSVR